MTGKLCSGSKRPHTPIVSESQRGKFGAELARRRRGKRGKMPGITQAELESHLHEAGGKRLPKRTTKKTKAKRGKKR
jgi:hypothetical protein